MHAQLMGRRSWRALTDEEKQLRLDELRRRQQAQIEVELRFLRRR
ncbi:hypothetical protein [Nocardioides aquiterrae]|uniref:Transposase n=1 Tax=Nocardioides aquiterrae TaxID=203799 RepID=A0ABP4EWG1_9ACTN